MEAKLGPLEKRIKKLLASIEIKFFKRTATYIFLDHKGRKKLWMCESRTS
jgi:hypothetical protein